MKHRLVLNYTLGSGMMTPYLDALADGVALASQCAQCARTAFPPERHCQCKPSIGEPSGLHWCELSGNARIVITTDGPGGSFALVQFDGADNQTVCRITNPQNSGTGAKLQPAMGEKPGVAVRIVGEEVEING